MGLDTTHNAWHGPYSSFDIFRKKLAKVEGFDLDSMVGFGGKNEWSSVKSKLQPLLNHSDCEGHIPPSKCKQIAERLWEIHATLSQTDPEEQYFAEKVKQFADGAILAYNKREKT